MAYTRSTPDRSSDRGVAARNRARLLLGLILVVAGLLRFHRLDWDDRAWAHPDERAVASQAFDMMVRDDYRPTIHTWGHFAYYTTIFAYKSFLWVQHALNGDPTASGERLVSVAGPAVPHFRDLVRGGKALPLGLAILVVGWLGIATAGRPRGPRALAIAVVAFAAVALAAAPWIRTRLLAPVDPDYDDVIFMGRFLSALYSTASVGLVYAIGARLYRPAVGLLAAAFLAVAVVPIQLAHFYVVDTPQTFAVLVAMLLAALVLRPAVAGSGDIETTSASAAVPWTPLLLNVFVGVAVGVALANKFSSLPLLALPLVVHVLSWKRVGRLAPLAAHSAVMLSYVAALGAWFALEPWAWENPFAPFAEAVASSELSRRWLEVLFSRDFADQIREQSLMVQGRGGGPWVQQFAGTKPFLTVTGQLVRFGLGWPLGLLAIAGFAWCALSNLRRRRAEDLLLLSWAVVLFVTLATVKATFTRYTAPLVPFLCLFAALLCMGRDGATERRPSGGWSRWPISRRVGAAAAALALAGALVHSLAFVRIYSGTHAWTYASLWIFKNVATARADGEPTRIAHEDWDDEIPLRLEPFQPELYGSVVMTLYEGEGEEKVGRLAQWLEEADWICLPTTRLYGTILGVSERYPVTAGYYKALFAGRLGFTLRRTVHDPPRLGGLALDDLVGADESRYIYDHPKAVIFEKTERLDRSELERRIRDLAPETEALSRAQLLRWRESTQEQVLNIARDPYLDDAVVTHVELESIAHSEGLDDGSTRALLAAVDAAHAAVGAVDAGAVETIVGSTSPQADGAEIDGLRRRLESLATGKAHRAGDLRRIVLSAVREGAARDRLIARLRYPVDGRLLSRDAVLAKLDRVEIGAGEPPAGEPAIEMRAREGRIVKVVASSGKGLQLLHALAWLAALEALGLAVLPWAARLFSAMPGTGYLLAKILGWVLAAQLCWIVVGLGVADLGTPLTWVAALTLAVAAWAPRGVRRDMSALFPPRRLLLVSELLFVATFAGFALVRAWNPEILWGEKTMDFSLLNAVLRGGTAPQYEPWFAGVPLNYYYFGFVLVGFLTLLASTPSAIAFNLANAVIPALTVLGAFALTHALTRRIRWGLAGAALVGFVANLDVVYQLASTGQLAAAWRDRMSTALESHGLLLGSLLVVVEAPFAAIKDLFVMPSSGSMWDSYWATSRALSEGLINEYPVWSWLFADLHAHVIATPLALLVLALIFAIYLDRTSSTPRDGMLRAATWATLALVLSAQAAANTWDFLAYSSVLVLALGAASIGAGSPARASTSTERSLPASWTGLGSGVKLELLFVAAWTLLWPLVGVLHPYWLGLVSSPWVGAALAIALVALARQRDRPVELLESGGDLAARVGREALLPALLVAAGAVLFQTLFLARLAPFEVAVQLNRDGLITAVQALRHFGLFALLTAAWVTASVTRVGKGAKARPRSILLFGAAVLAAASLLRFESAREASGLALYALLLAAVVVTAILRCERPEHRFAAVLLASGWGLAALSELIVIGDRMNTVFKLYYVVWLLLAIGSAAVMASIFERGAEVLTERLPNGRDVRLRLLPASAAVLLAVAIVVAVGGTARAVLAVVTLERRVSDRPTLDGLDFLRHDDRDAELFETIAWLDRTVRGPAVVAEAFTQGGYDESARISQYTGLPIVLGWPHHLKQRGRTDAQIAMREADLRRLYTSTDAPAVARICDRYRLRYIVVGDLERDRYGSPELRLSAMDFLDEAFRSSAGGYVVYQVIAASAVPAPAQSSPAM